MNVCVIFRCGKSSRTNGITLCGMHYMRLNRYGSTDYTKICRYLQNTKCVIKDCNEKIRCKSLCAYHYRKKTYEEHPERRIYVSNYQKEIWYKRPEIREKERKRLKEWKKNNPTSTYKFGLEQQIAMDLVRIRDKNTCKWYNCGKTHKETQIDVHHIFPRSEYPELELIEQYMLCYCVEHHTKWHEMRGDKVGILMRGRLNKLLKSEAQVVT